MADNVTTQTATLASVPDATEIETHDTGDGHRQIVAVGGSGDKTMSQATPTDASATSILAANADRKSAIIYNNSDGVVYVGSTGVASTTGIPVAAGQSFTDTTSVDAWFARCASGVTGDLRIIEVA